jgi:hypothetical protein
MSGYGGLRTCGGESEDDGWEDPEREERRRGASPLGRLRRNTALSRYRDATHLLPVLVFQRNPVPGVTAQSEEGEQKGVEEGRGQEE